MRDIEGVEEAMAVLQPYWEDIEADFDRHNARYLSLAETDHVSVGRILRAHLIVDYHIHPLTPDGQ
ncbi:MAG: hypothetical protein GY789_06745 [Hyphomicrobiales bacterium]|nr:hypothetical protein [Hyphomicrobiales bacterium]